MQPAQTEAAILRTVCVCLSVCLSVKVIIIIIIEFNSGTIKIELDNTMWTVQPEQGRKG